MSTPQQVLRYEIEHPNHLQITNAQAFPATFENGYIQGMKHALEIVENPAHFPLPPVEPNRVDIQAPTAKESKAADTPKKRRFFRGKDQIGEVSPAPGAIQPEDEQPAETAEDIPPAEMPPPVPDVPVV